MKFVTEEERWKTVNSHVTEQFYCSVTLAEGHLELVFSFLYPC